MKPKVFLIEVTESRLVPVIAHYEGEAIDHVNEFSERGAGFWEDEAVARTTKVLKVVRKLNDLPARTKKDANELLMFTDEAEQDLREAMELAPDESFLVDLKEVLAFMRKK
jgi:hypothetical protein